MSCLRLRAACGRASLGAARCAPLVQRTEQALRRSRRADGRTQLHHGLVEVAGTLAIEQRFRSLPRRFPSLGRAKHALQHALDVAIDDGDRLSERDARDRGRGVASDAGKFAPLFRSAREIPRCARARSPSPPDAFVARDGSSRARSTPRARTVSRAAARACTVGNLLQEARVVVQHRGHARLLQHDLRDPHAIGIGITPPRQIAAMLRRTSAASARRSLRRLARD